MSPFLPPPTIYHSDQSEVLSYDEGLHDENQILLKIVPKIFKIGSQCAFHRTVRLSVSCENGDIKKFPIKITADCKIYNKISLNRPVCVRLF